MSKKPIPVILQLSLIGILIVIVSLIIQIWIPQIKISRNWIAILILLYLFTLIVIRLLKKYIHNKISYFANAFMLVNFGKLILFSAIIVIYSIFNGDDAISFTITFFLYYLMFTAFEVVSLLKIQKKM